MKRILLLALALSLVLPFLPAQAQAGPISLTYSCFFPPTHGQAKLAEAWCREVEKRSNGAVKIDFYPGGTLTSAKDCYDGVVQGMSDIGFSVLGYSRGRFPVMAAIDLPLGYTSGQEATRVANAVFEKFKPAELGDVKPLYFHAHGPGLLHTSKKPVKTLEDLKGLKIRTTGNSGLLIGALGGTPVAMSMPDSYQSLEKGVVDGSVHPVESNKGWNLAEVVKYMTESYSVGYSTCFFVVMNKAKWASLPPSAQQAIEAVSKEWIGKHGKDWDDIDVAGRQFFLSKGGTIIALDAAEAARWKKTAQPMLDDYAKDATSKGLKGREILDFTIKSLKPAK